MRDTPRILVVDDESSVLLTLVANLELEGFDVVDADSGARALALIEAHDFDLVLSDVRMPGMDGVTLLQRIRRRHPDLPVVLMTAFAIEAALAEALAAGVHTIVPKPFSIEELVSILAVAARRPVVLVIEHDQGAESAAAVLVAASARVQVVTTAEDALAVVRSGATDVCVVDVGAPGLPGPELIERIQAEGTGVACIALSGMDLAAVLRRLAQRAVHAMRKPIDGEALLRTIAELRKRPLRA